MTKALPEYVSVVSEFECQRTAHYVTTENCTLFEEAQNQQYDEPALPAPRILTQTETYHRSSARRAAAGAADMHGLFSRSQKYACGLPLALLLSCDSIRAGLTCLSNLSILSRLHACSAVEPDSIPAAPLSYCMTSFKRR